MFLGRYVCLVGGAGLVYKESGVFFRRNFFLLMRRQEKCVVVCAQLIRFLSGVCGVVWWV